MTGAADLRWQDSCAMKSRQHGVQRTRNMKAAAEATPDNYALAYAQRRSWVLGSWSYGAILAAGGTAYVIASALTGNDPAIGVGTAVLGGAVALLGWLASAPKRFSRRVPKPAMDVWRAEQAIRINKPAVIAANILMPLILLAMTFLAPRGMAPDVIPITAMLAVWPPLVGALMLRVSKLLVERGEIYDRWLQGRGDGNG